MFGFLQRYSCTNSTLLNAAKQLKILATHVLQLKTRTRHRTGPAHKMYRIWEPTVNAAQMPCTEPQYKLMSYNILAQDLLTEHLYLYLDIEPALLRWDYRLHRLKDEINDLCPDILCLQEMQYNHLKNLVALIRGPRKLEYVFKKKTGHRTDGCAIIYDGSKFRLLEERGVEYHTPGNSLLNRENVALLAKFNLREKADKQFVVATTHLLYNPRRQDVRMAQVDVLLAALRAFSLQNQDNKDVLLPIILSGDFNFEPNTPPYTLLSNPSKSPTREPQQEETTPPEHKDCQTKFLKSSCGDKANPDDGLEMCPLNFGFNTASTFQDRWITVDYILHSIGKNREKVKIWSTYKLPAVRDCIKVGKIPNIHLGSDHYSLAITFSVP